MCGDHVNAKNAAKTFTLDATTTISILTDVLQINLGFPVLQQFYFSTYSEKQHWATCYQITGKASAQVL